MALAKTITNPARGTAVDYWVVDSLTYEKATGLTTIGVAGWENFVIREAAFPVADMRLNFKAEGVLNLKQAYAHLKTLEEFEGAISDEYEEVA